MKFKKIIMISALAVAFGASFNAAAFGLGDLAGGNSGSASSGNVEKDIESFLKTADEAHALTNKSVKVLGDALLTKEDMQKNEADLEAANKLQDVKEREAAIAKAEEDLQAKLAKVNYAEKSKEMAKLNDKKKNAQVGASMYNFVLGLLKDKELIGKSSGLISSASSNPMMATKLIKVKDAAASISGQIGNMGKIASGLQQLSSTIKSMPMPTTDSAKPVSAAD
jgi:hypothetical protein